MDAASVQYNSTFLVVGGITALNTGQELDSIYQYEATTESWELLPQTLSSPTYSHTAFMVPASIFPKCPPVQYLMTMGGEYRKDAG